MNAAILIPVLLTIAMACQWIAWRVKLPAILFLLLSGLFIGPGLGLIPAEALPGSTLLPLVSLAVAIILFEGSLTLETSEILEVRKIVQRMITIGALVTWLVVSCATYLIFDFSWQISTLFGAIVIVTGPTVIVPMLRSVRPTAKIANILRWEGIAIDPIGALMAVLTYEFILLSAEQLAISNIFLLFFQTVFTGIAIGIFSGWLLGYLLTRNFIPEYLHNFATLSAVLLSFSGSNYLAHESGLITVTVMGMWLANRTELDIHPILNFKENLSLLLISMLFIVLAARIDLKQLMDISGSVILLLLILQFVARPLKILVSTFGLDVSWKERALLSWIAPRGIVAAAISAVFSDNLIAVGYEEAKLLVPLTFGIIIGTVVSQSFTAGYVARLLGLASPSPSGFLIVGANRFARILAKELTAHGFRCVLADTNSDNIKDARMAGLETYYGNPASEHADLHLDITGIGHLLAMSHQRHLNIVSAIHFRSDFGSQNIFRLSNTSELNEKEQHKTGSGYEGVPLFGEGITYSKLNALAFRDAEMKSTKLTEEFSWENFLDMYGENRIPLFEIDAKGKIHPFSTELELKPAAGSTVLTLESEKIN